MKRTALLLTMIMVLAMIFTLSGCSFSLDGTLTQGTFVEGTFVEDLLVKSYNINFVVNGETTTVTCKQGLVPTAPAVEDYETDNKSYTFIGWDKEIVAATEDTTYTAVFSASTKLFDVTFAYGAGKSDTVKLHWGAEPKAPTSGLNYKTDDKVYTFIGWDKEIVPVNGEVVYTAQYEESAREYNVYFVYGDGTYDAVKVAYGTVPTAPAEVPTIETDAKIYTFKGWDKEIVAVTGDAEYYATYDETLREFTITFIYGGKTETATYKYGDTVVLPVAADYSDAAYNYTFKGWDKEAAPVSGDATYTASYEQALREYTITFIYEGKTETATYKYGETVVLPKTVYYTDEANTYAFKGWDKEAAPVSGDATYTAEYVVGKLLYSQDFNDKDFDRNSTAARYNEVLDSTWTLNLMAGGAYAKTVVDANDPNNKYVVAGLLADNNKGSAQLNAKDATKKGGEGSLAAMGDFTKLTFTVDLAAKEGVTLAKGYIRFRNGSNYYMFFAHNRDDFDRGDEVKFNNVVLDDVTITTTMQTFTFEFDFAAGTATLIVDGVQKYTGAIDGPTGDLLEYIKGSKEYLFNWALDTMEGENAIIIDNLALVAYN